MNQPKKPRPANPTARSIPPTKLKASKLFGVGSGSVVVSGPGSVEEVGPGSVVGSGLGSGWGEVVGSGFGSVVGSSIRPPRDWQTKTLKEK